MTVINVTDATLKGTVTGPTFTGSVDGAKFTGDVTYIDSQPVPPDPGPGPGTAPNISYVKPVGAVRDYWKVAAGGTTPSNHVMVHGTAAPSAQVKVFLGTTLKGTTTAGADGNWSCDVDGLSDSAKTLTATANNGPASAVFNFVVKANATGATVGSNIPNGAGPFQVDGMKYTTLNDPRNNKACVLANSHQFDIILKPDDLWNGSSNRSEIGPWDTSTGDGVTWNILGEFLLSASSPINNASGSGNFFVIAQMGNEMAPINFNGPCLEFNLGYPPATTGDQLGINAAIDGKIINCYCDPSGNIRRGVWHNFEIYCKPSKSDGFIQIWLNGEKVVDKTGFYANPGYWWKVGLYRGGRLDQTQTASYRNTHVRLT